MKFFPILSRLFILLFVSLVIFQNSATFSQINDSVNLDTVKAGRFDTGKMWTFEYPPVTYFREQYNFTPDEKWYEHVQLATLKFADYCSASFISEDGLIMTNHHCARESVSEIMAEGEDFHKDGFIAWELSDERTVPGLYVEQCVKIEDVSDEILSAIESAQTDSERLAIEAEKITEIENRFSNDDENFVRVTALYFGGRYSLYHYKKFNDVRLVFAPESQAGYFGGDYDNFTYPRYNLDCAFFRVYDKDGKPLKVDHYFKWSISGAQPGEVVFVTGNPASTNRLNTVAQLEFARDFTYPETISMVSSLINLLEEIIKDDSASANYLSDQLFSYYNSQKAYTGMLEGLRNPVLMQKKKVFENALKEKVQSVPELNAKYGNIWNEIEYSVTELQGLIKKRRTLSYSTSDMAEYFSIANQLIGLAEDLELAETDSTYAYTHDELEEFCSSLIPEDFDFDRSNELLKNKVELLYAEFGDDEFVIRFTNGKKGNEAVEDILSRSFLTSVEKIRSLISKGPDAILNSSDPFIDFIKYVDKQSEIISARMDELSAVEATASQKLGRVIFEVYGTSIPPDATFTLRISDGVVKGFDYNGTIAPPITTFYGLLDRYYSFDGKFPWNLHERWLDAPEEFDFSTPFNFVSTNDVVGGNSGSPIINKNAEAVGVAFDGNIQSLPGDFIYDPEVNRSIGVHSAGMLEAIKDLYQFERLAKEIIIGKSSD